MNQDPGYTQQLTDAMDAFLAFIGGETGQSEAEFLQEHEHLRDLLEPMLREQATPGTTLDDADLAQTATAEVVEGRELGDFRLIREVGRGGMGVVYEAEQISLGRRVALKVLPAHLTLHPTAIGRFKREATTAASVEHPGIVAVHAVGSQGDTHYFAMDLIEGRPLDQILNDDDGGASIQTLVGYAIQVAEALHHAAEHGIIHRDVKPQNILIRSDGTAVLTDFGLAREMGLPSLTMTGDFAGTPYYVSPEQAQAKQTSLDQRSDVYSLGATLYEMLTGQRPFEGRTSGDVLAAIIQREPPDPQKLNPKLAPDLCAITLKALEKEPGRRYQTAGEFAEDLRAFLEYRPVMARRASTAVRLRRWVKRQPLKAALAAVLLLSVPTLSVFGGYILATKEKVEVGEQTIRETELDRLLTVAYRESSHGLRQRAFAAFDQALQLDPGNPEALAGKALLLWRSGKGDAAWALVSSSTAWPAAARGCRNRLRALFRRESNQEPTENPEREIEAPQTAVEWFIEGQIEMEQGHRGDDSSWPRAHACLKSAVLHSRVVRRTYVSELMHVASHVGDLRETDVAMEVVARRWPEDVIAARPHQARAYFESGDVETAIRILRAAVDQDPEDSTLLFTLGAFLGRSGDNQAGVRVLRRANEHKPDDPYILANLGECLRAGGDHGAGLQALRRADQLMPDAPEILNNLGAALMDSGDAKGAVQVLRRARKLAPNHVYIHLRLGRALQKTGDWRAALDALNRAADLDPKQAPTKERVAWEFVQLATAQLEQGNPRQAIEPLQRAVKIDPNLADGHRLLGVALRETGDVAGAIRALRRSIELDPDVASAHWSLGIALGKTGDWRGAIDSHRRATQLDPDNPESFAALGAALTDNGDPLAGAKAFRRVVQLDPNNAMAHANLGFSLKQHGDFPGALIALRQATKLAPKDIRAHQDLGDVLWATGDVKAAAESFRRALAIEPDDAGVLASLGGALTESGNPAAGAKALRRAVELAPDNARAHENLGIALARLEDWTASARVCRTALGKWPTNDQLHQTLCYVLSRSSDRRGLCQEYERRAEAMFAQGDRESAINAAKQALMSWKADPKADPQLGAKIEAALRRYQPPK